MTHLHWRSTSAVGNMFFFSVKATDDTTDVFVGPQCRCHCTSTYRTNSIWRTDSGAICSKKTATSNIKTEFSISTSYRLGSLAYGACGVRERL
jgi:hypothetical protein